MLAKQYSALVLVVFVALIGASASGARMSMARTSPEIVMPELTEPPRESPTPTVTPSRTPRTPTPTGTPPTRPTSTPTGTPVTRPTGTPTHTPISPPTSTATETVSPTQTTRPSFTPTETPTATPTPRPSDTPTITPSPTITLPPSPTPDVDLVIDALEVTQGIQDLDNGVHLIANKRTYVRGHVSANKGDHPYVMGRFTLLWNGASYGPYYADNPNEYITVKSNPDRAKVNDSFYFEIPPNMLGGETIHICLNLNEDHNVSECNYDNNWACVSVKPKYSPQMKVKIYTVSYQHGPFTYEAQNDQVQALVSWLRRAYPVAFVTWQVHMLDWSGAQSPVFAGCGAVNNELAALRALYLANNDAPFFDPNWRFYGMVVDAGGFMQGCAASIPSFVASGPTGSGWPFGGVQWDTDGSYGDWYGAHELGHAYGRYHTMFCGAKAGVPYPYPNGIIGGPAGDTDRFYGWDIELQEVYPPNWIDIMSYCDWLWISDFTYEGLRSQLISEASGTALDVTHGSEADEYLAVFGQVDLSEMTAELGTLYRLQNYSYPESPIPSADWSIAFFDEAGETLALYPFTPKNDAGRGTEEYTMASIIETVPWVNGTARVAIQYQGTELAACDVSETQPNVEMIYPNGGEVLDEDTVTVTWEGSDPDGDGLVYALLYSPDGGSSWEAVAVGMRETECALDLDDIPGSDEALFRVVASDGVNTAQSDSQGTFQVSFKGPKVWITSPEASARFTPRQQVVLVGEGYDTEDGCLPDQGLRWSSDIDGELGIGSQLSVTHLQTGWHAITLEATDSHQQTANTTVSIYIGDQPYVLYLPMVMQR